MIDPIRRAEQVQRLLDHQVMREAREAMRDELTRRMWQRADLPADQQAKLDAYVRHFGEFFAWFERVLADGKMAQADIDEKNRVRKFRERIQAKF